MTTCPCCFDRLLRHIHNHEIYFFCRTCWQEMPVLSEEKCSLQSKDVMRKLPTILHQREKRNASCCGLQNKENVAHTTLVSV
ncbi:hypothetical protein BWI75_01580 [Gloeocapsopsis sp. AAB1 = 1H9]|uniref:Uncharacterized protein n=1 Tax=Gloeocapsopsis dulcis AAB1 = 1H9 TaxID=1433147 RepID=A0A6N8FQH7_9CHRO|nr:hypothetical protein [Gloeocapsopsis dulcis AAB1 = 1H9]